MVLAARLLAVTISVCLVLRKTTMAVMILVRLAIGRRTLALFAYSTAPVSKLTTRTDFAPTRGRSGLLGAAGGWGGCVGL